MNEVSVKPLKPYQALILIHDSERVMVISDLHLGWEISLNREGFHFPAQMNRLLKKTFNLIRIYKPTDLIILGDLKHTVSGIEVEEWRDIPEFIESLTKRVSKITVIPGNHDGNISSLLPDEVTQAPVTGMVLWNQIGLFHGHSWPDPKLLGCTHLIMGHIHPVISFRDPSGLRVSRQVWVRTRCDGEKTAKSMLKHLNIKIDGDIREVFLRHFDTRLKSPSLIVLPSFNEVLGGVSVNVNVKERTNSFIGPILRSGCADIENAEIFLLDGTFLGKVKHLHALNY